MKPDRRPLPFARLAICLLLVSISTVAQQTQPAQQAQQPPPPTAPTPQPPTSPEPDFKCPRAADPRRRARECNDHDFGLDETLENRWDYIRDAMKHIGIVPTASYVGALQTNAAGGNHNVWSYAGLLSFGVSTDFSELLKIPGLSAYVGASWGTGGNIAGSLNSVIPPNGLYAPSFYLGEMYLQERLHNGKFTLLAGRLAAGNGFATLPVFTNYVTWGINPNPFSLGQNDVTFFGPPPGSQWGAQASYSVSSALQLQAGVFNNNLNSANGASHGTDFALQEGNKGVLSIVEADYLVHQGNKKHKPGQITVGFLRNSDTFPALNNPLAYSDGYNSVYALAQQMVYRPGGPDTTQGATLWGGWTFNSKDLVSSVPEFWSAGTSYVGLIPARKDDTVSIGFIRSEGSKYAPPLNTEGLIELNYQWIHSRYLTIAPHAQYLWRNDNQPSRNILVLGVQLSLTL
jgi:carbohydrate-selective porin OprB